MNQEVAIFAGGCFWGIQFYFDQVPGVLKTEVGYIGGHIDEPTYEQVCSQATGHAEAVRIIFDPDRVSYKTLLKHFFMIHDPTQLDRQGPDIGDNYRSEIFVTDDTQAAAARTLIDTYTKEKKYKEGIVTKVTPAGIFWVAEDYHQKYAERTGRGTCHVDYQPLDS